MTHSTDVMKISYQTMTEPIMTQMPSEQANSMLITIIAAAAGGSFVTTLIAIVVCCVYLKCKNLGKEVNNDQVENISLEVNATLEGTSHETHNPDNNPTLNTNYEELNKDRIPAHVYQELSTGNKDPKRKRVSEPGTSRETSNPDHNQTLNINYEELNTDRIPVHVYQELSTDNKDAKRKCVSEPGTSNETSNPDHNQTLNTNYVELNKDRIPAHFYQELSADNNDAKRQMYQTHIVDMNAAELTFNPEVESPAEPNDDAVAHYEVPDI